jgi:hypothetical protein
MKLIIHREKELSPSFYTSTVIAALENGYDEEVLELDS